MPIYLDPVQDLSPTAGTSPVICDDEYRVQPSATIREGCEIVTKQRALISQKGVRTRIQWPLRHPDGTPVNMLSCVCSTDPGSISESSTSESSSSSSSVSVSVSESACDATGGILVRFAYCDRSGQIYEVTATSPNPEQGLVNFQLPAEVADEAGIYITSIAVVDADGVPFFTETGLISVEPGLWGNYANATIGPLTLTEIRMALRDSPMENSLLQESEFSDAEIVQAVIWPVLQWNETPPPVAYYNCRNFPFRWHWRQAVVTELLRVAAHNYMRNNLNMNHAGVSGNMKDKFRDYLALAESYREEYRRFVVEKKVSINAGMGVMSLSGLYGGY